MQNDNEQTIGAEVPGRVIYESQPLAFLRSERTIHVLRAIHKARKSFGKVVRDATAHGSKYDYDYPTLSSVKQAIAHHLIENDLVEMTTHEPLRWFEGNVVLRTQTVLFYVGELLKDAEPEYIGVRVEAAAGDAGPKGIGSLQTYLRRYANLGLHDLAAVDDDGDAAGKVNPPRPVRTGQDPRRTTPDRSTEERERIELEPLREGVDTIPTARFGHDGMKGQPLSDIAPADLEWYIERLGSSAANPKDPKYAEVNIKHALSAAQYLLFYGDSNDEPMTKKTSEMVARIIKRWAK